jgi:hypothetical protein
MLSRTILMTLQQVFTRPSSPNQDPKVMTTNLMCQGSKEAAVDPIVLVGKDEAAAEAIMKAKVAAEVEEKRRRPRRWQGAQLQAQTRRRWR